MAGICQRCIITHIAPDGQRHTIEAEAASLNRACVWYNYRSHESSAGLPKPQQESIFEVQVGDTVHRTSWARVMAWANKLAKCRHIRDVR